jgi:integrase
MAARPRKIPSYRLHKPTGQAVVRLDGHDHYLGKHGTPASHEAYDRLIGEWLASGLRRTPAPTAPTPATELTVGQLILVFWQHARQHYKKADGTPTGELDNLRDALRPLRRLYSRSPAHTFGPLALRAVQQAMIQAGLCRTTVNARVNRIRRVIKWAVGVELLPPAVYQGLQAVPGLQRDRTNAPEPSPVAPVCETHLQATLPHLPAPVRAMVELQLLAGCRPGEVLALRALDLNTSGAVWTYHPRRHKNQHRGLDRVIFLGPQAQAILRPFLTTDLEGFLFSPRRYVEALQARRAAARRTKRTPSELRRRKAKPKRQPAARYSRRSYRQAIVRACAKAGVPAWSPLQLRHTAATLIRARYGVEAARVILGHSKVETSQIYAERDLHRAEQIMAEIG